MHSPLTEAFRRFFASEAAGGYVLLACTALSLALANSAVGPEFRQVWQEPLGGLSLQAWVNDGLMAIFFLLIGLELERELYVGELSRVNEALLPAVAAAGGMVVPAAIHSALNFDLPTAAGFGIPMATDIAFAIGVLAILGARVPTALKVFVVAFAVMDDLGAIVVIAAFYSSALSPSWLAAAAAVFAALVACNRSGKVWALRYYLAGGALLWFFLLRSGVHATLAGVLLAFAIPFRPAPRGPSPSHRLELALQRPVAFGVLPVFALANTGVVFGPQALDAMLGPNGIGIIAGLLLGKPLGITLACLAAVGAGICRLPGELRWAHVVGAGMLGGIGFTMSIFIADLAFRGDSATIDGAKLAILAGSLLSGIAGCVWLSVQRPRAA